MNKLDQLLMLHKFTEIFQEFEVSTYGIVLIHSVDSSICRKLIKMGCIIKPCGKQKNCDTADLFYNNKEIGSLFSKKSLIGKGNTNYFCRFEKGVK